MWNRGTGVLQGMAATFSAAGVFGTAENIEASAASASNMQVDVDDAGTFTTVFRLGNEVVAARRPSAGSWTAVERVSGTPDTIFDVGMGVGPTGTVVAAWTEVTASGGVADLYASVRPAGGAWGTPEPLETDDFDSANEPSVAVDREGNAIVGWYQTGVGDLDSILTNRFTAGTGWAGSSVLTTAADADGEVYQQQVRMDAAGNAFVVHYVGGLPDGASQVWAHRFQAGVGFAPPVVIGTSTPSDYDNPSIAVSPQGAAYSTLNYRDGTTRETRAAIAR